MLDTDTLRRINKHRREHFPHPFRAASSAGKEDFLVLLERFRNYDEAHLSAALDEIDRMAATHTDCSACSAKICAFCEIFAQRLFPERSARYREAAARHEHSREEVLAWASPVLKRLAAQEQYDAIMRASSRQACLQKFSENVTKALARSRAWMLIKGELPPVAAAWKAAALPFALMKVSCGEENAKNAVLVWVPRCESGAEDEEHMLVPSATPCLLCRGWSLMLRQADGMEQNFETSTEALQALFPEVANPQVEPRYSNNWIESMARHHRGEHIFASPRKTPGPRQRNAKGELLELHRRGQQRVRDAIDDKYLSKEVRSYLDDCASLYRDKPEMTLAELLPLEQQMDHLDEMLDSHP